MKSNQTTSLFIHNCIHVHVDVVIDIKTETNN